MASPGKSSGDCGSGSGGASAPAPPTPTRPPDTIAAAAAPASSAAAAAEWSKSFQAYYGGGAAVPQFFSPATPWGAQMMGMYGGPAAIAYAPFYGQPAPPGAMYAQHPLPLGVTYPAVEVEGKSKNGGSKGNSDRGASGSRENVARSGDSDTVGSSDTREEEGEDKNPSTTKKRTYDMLAADADTTNPATPGQYIGAESSYSGRARTVPKLPVSAPGRANSSDPQTNLSIGMDVWSSPHSGAVPMKVGSGDQKWIQDERELKRERRKQSNRESARRSRLRKQQECDDLTRKVSELTNENEALRVEVENLQKYCDNLTAENKSLEEEMTKQFGPNFLLVLGAGANPTTNGHFLLNPPSSPKDGTSGDNPESTSS